MKEIWKSVKGYEGLYEVSDKGNVRSLDRTITDIYGKTRRYKSKDISKVNHKGGYLYANLSNNSKVHKHFIHRLVAEAFLDNPSNKELVNHKDGNKKNNSLENLEWVTHFENVKHAEINKLYHGKLTDEQVREMRELFDKGIYNYEQLANKYNLSYSFTARVINKKYYKYV